MIRGHRTLSTSQTLPPRTQARQPMLASPTNRDAPTSSSIAGRTPLVASDGRGSFTFQADVVGQSSTYGDRPYSGGQRVLRFSAIHVQPASQ